MSQLFDSIKKIMISKDSSLQNLAPKLYAFYTSSELSVLLTELQLLEDQYLKENPKECAHPEVLLFLQELARPAAIVLQSHTPAQKQWFWQKEPNLLPTIMPLFMNSNGKSSPEHETEFREQIRKVQDRSLKELSLNCLLHLAEKLSHYERHCVHGLAGSKTADSFFEVLTQPHSGPSLLEHTIRRLQNNATFTQCAETNLVLRAQYDPSFEVYDAVRYIIVYQALDAFEDAMVEDLIINRQKPIKIADPKTKVTMLADLKETKKTYPYECRKTLSNMNKRARVQGWQNVEYTFIEELTNISPEKKEILSKHIDNLKFLDSLEQNPQKSGVFSAIKLQSRIVNPTPVNVSTKQPLQHCTDKQSVYFWELQQQFKSYKASANTRFNQFRLNFWHNAHAFHKKKQARLDKMFNTMKEQLDPTEVEMNQVQLQEAMRKLLVDLQGELKSIQIDEKQHNRLRILLGDSTMVRTLKGAISYLQQHLPKVEEVIDPQVASPH